MEDPKEIFELVGRDPSAWLLSAKTLKTSADLVRIEVVKTIEAYRPLGTALDEKQFLPRPYMLLSGLALELLLKGIRVAQKPELVTGKLDKNLGKHGLVKLAEAAQCELSEEEHSLLDRLTQFVLWGGRYPIPKEPGNTSREYLHTDAVLIDSLFERFSAIIGMLQSTANSTDYQQ